MTLNHVVWTTWAWRTEWSHVSKVCWVRRKKGANKCWSWVELRVEWTKWRNIWAARFEQCGVFSASLPLLVLYCVMKDYSALWGVGLLMFLIFLSFSLCPPLIIIFIFLYVSLCSPGSPEFFFTLARLSKCWACKDMLPCPLYFHFSEMPYRFPLRWTCAIFGHTHILALPCENFWQLLWL